MLTKTQRNTKHTATARRALSALLMATGAASWILYAPAEAAAQEPAECLSSDPSQWPSPSKPYFLVAFDTSGSMASSVSGSLSCAGFPTNRIGHARCALRNTVQAFAGEVNLGLMSFAWRSRCTGSLGTCNNYASCSPQYAPGNSNWCGPWITEPTLGVNVHSGGHLVIPVLQDHYWSLPPDPTNVPSLLEMSDNTCGAGNGISNGDGTWNAELGADSNTPLGGILFDAYRYLSGTYTEKWGGAAVSSPLGTAAQGERPCRSINIILITDGDETCDSGVSPTPIAGGCRSGFGAYLNNAGERLASYEADRMYTQGITFGGQNFKVRTHVIAFAGASITAANNIATCGGTSAAYSTANEAQLSQALSNIISSAIKPEVCDNGDNNCNGCTDEGYTHYCNTQQTCCAWGNQTQRNTCLANYQASITPADPDGDLTLLPCTTPAMQSQPPNWLCYDPKEICDNVDNNCNGQVDEGFNKCGSPAHCPVAETCNGEDDDCDNIIDNAPGNGTPYSACPNNCQPSAEICDGCDNDCDGVADNGVADVPCGSTAPGCPNNCAGTRSCISSGVAVPIGQCTTPTGFGACNVNPQAEICDGCDNDCDGTIDNGVPATPCEPIPGLVYKDTFPQSVCEKGSQPCNGTCSGGKGPDPSGEICDGLDNDCDGQVDEGTLPGVGASCGNGTPPCQKGNFACVGGQLVCQGGSQPQPEVCNGIDDNCNGQVDEQPLTDAPASSGCWNLPPTGCNPLCSHQNLQWCPPTGGTCNGKGSLATPCQTGTLTCAGTSQWTCVGGTLPAPESCDGADNNCNGSVDENPGAPVGETCGIDTGECQTGNWICDQGVLQCTEVGPQPEVCDGKDNDCDGVNDNGVGLQGPCTPAYDTSQYPGVRDKGECKPGVTECDPTCANPSCTKCAGGVGPSPEVCDGLDNDCDGQVDESGAPPDGINGTADPKDPTHVIGQPCGVDEGECKAGTFQCTNGAVVCQGGVGPQPEQCDCLDNDCDGTVDEDPEPGEDPICAPGKTCVVPSAGNCQCAPPCAGGEFPCPTGAVCKQAPKSSDPSQVADYCISDACGDCSKKTQKTPAGDIICAPEGTATPYTPVCVCKGNKCTTPCDGVQCPSGQKCVEVGPSTGTCQPQDNCYFFGCQSGKACNGGVCVDDPCDPNPCQPGEVCKPTSSFNEARCVASCAGVTCPAGKKCVEGQCAGCDADCPPGQTCALDQDGGGACVPDQCVGDAGVVCGNGAYCDPATGQCGNAPCEAVKCPTAQLCVDGECQWAPEGGAGTGGTGGNGGGGPIDGGAAAGGSSGSGGSSAGGSSGGTTDDKQPGVWGLATGGGGCACKAAGSRERPAGAALLAAALALAFARRRRKTPPGRPGREVSR